MDLFLHDKMEDYDYPKINQHLLNFLNNKPYSKKISWKTNFLGRPPGSGGLPPAPHGEERCEDEAIVLVYGIHNIG